MGSENTGFHWSSLATFLYFLVLLATIIRIFSRENRTSESRTAWVTVVLAIPFAGIAAYYYFGELNLGSRYHRRVGEVLKRLRKEVPVDYYQAPKAELEQKRAQVIFAAAKSVNGFEALSGNEVTLFPTGADMVDCLIRDIDAAKSTVHILTYIWLEDETGIRVSEAVARAAARGVKCRILADAYGSRAFLKSEYWQNMIDAGADCHAALPVNRVLFVFSSSRLDLRNHRKITIIDGTISYLGSRNIADEAFATKPKYAPWVDIMTRVKGPVVHQNQFIFMGDWLVAQDEPTSALLESTNHENDLPAHLSPVSDVNATVVADGPTLRAAAIPQVFETMFGVAREKLTITTPYFVPNEALVETLCAAAYRGLNIELILPKHNDSFVVAYGAESHYKELLAAGVRIFHYKPGLLHAKIISVDSELVMMGSTNLDRRSFDLNFENNMIFNHHELVSQILAQQDKYKADSEEVHLDEVENWSFMRRVRNNIFSMLSPIL